MMPTAAPARTFIVGNRKAGKPSHYAAEWMDARSEVKPKSISIRRPKTIGNTNNNRNGPKHTRRMVSGTLLLFLLLLLCGCLSTLPSAVRWISEARSQPSQAPNAAPPSPQKKKTKKQIQEWKSSLNILQFAYPLIKMGSVSLLKTYILIYLKNT